MKLHLPKVSKVNWEVHDLKTVTYNCHRGPYLHLLQQSFLPIFLNNRTQSLVEKKINMHVWLYFEQLEG